MLIMKVDYKNIDTEVRDKFVNYVKRCCIDIGEVDFEVFPTSLTIMIKNSKDTKVIEDIVDFLAKRNNIDVLECINVCPSGNNGIYKTIVFSKPESESKDGCYTEDFINEIVDRVVEKINTKREVTYSDAVKAISDDPCLLSGDKTAIISWLIPGLESDVYQAIINITESSMVGTDKLATILDIAKKASSIMGNE